MKDCLYRHFDTNGVLLYVGVSLAPISRLQHHSVSSEWFDEIVTITIERLTAAKAKGVKFGRKAKLDDNQVKAIQADVKAGELSMQAIADKYGIARNSVYRLAGAKEALAKSPA